AGEESGRAREILRLLTGGRIDLFQQGERKAQRGWLQGRFRVRLVNCFVNEALGLSASDVDGGIEVVIDYRDTSALVAQAKELADQGLCNWQIAEIMGCVRSRVTKLLKTWYESRGLPAPSGHIRRSEHPDVHPTPPLYQAISDSAMEMYF